MGSKIGSVYIKMATIRDRLWIWGQTAGSHHGNNNPYKLPGSSRMTPLEGACYLGLRNCCRVVLNDDPQPPFDQESMALESMDQVVWSIVGDSGSLCNDDGWGDLDEVIRQAKLFPNITGAVLDDFFIEKRLQAFSPQRLREIRAKLQRVNDKKLDLWVVLYDRDLDSPIQDYLNECDVITFWTWCGENLKSLDHKFDKFLRVSSDKRRLVGYYMWNYGEGKPLTMEQLEIQSERYYKWLKEGYIEGIIFCSNCIADLGLEAVEWIKNWITAIADEKI